MSIKKAIFSLVGSLMTGYAASVLGSVLSSTRHHETEATLGGSKKRERGRPGRCEANEQADNVLEEKVKPSSARVNNSTKNDTTRKHFAARTERLPLTTNATAKVTRRTNDVERLSDTAVGKGKNTVPPPNTIPAQRITDKRPVTTTPRFNYDLEERRARINDVAPTAPVIYRPSSYTSPSTYKSHGSHRSHSSHRSHRSGR